ncbi:uncharacterized protein YjcR [Bacillus pumilus]
MVEKEKRVHTKKGGQPSNVNALGNSGGIAPLRNQNAKTHGLYSKHMPAEAFEIMQDIQEFRQLIYFGSRYKFNSQPL